MKYSDIHIGQKAEVTHEITSEDIKKFTDLTGDDNRLHVDPVFARKTSFKRPVAHGMLGASFISTVIGTKLPGDGALWYSQTLEFLRPVRIGDRIKVVAEVVAKNDREESIELSTVIYNQNKQKVTDGYAKVKVVSIESPKDSHDSKHKDLKIKRYALIAGASGGIGLAVTKRLLEEGFYCFGHYNKNEQNLLELQDELNDKQRLIIIQSDLTVQDGVDKLISKVKRHTNYINSFVYTPSPSVPDIGMESLEWSDFSKQFKLHLEVPFNLIQNLLDSLASGGAGVVFITSQTVEHPFPRLTHYTVAKSGLLGLVKSLAIELAGRKIRINAVSPSIADTDLNSELPEKIKLLSAAKTPLKRLVTPIDIAEAICFLADSSKSPFLTGETLRVNGGQVMN